MILGSRNLKKGRVAAESVRDIYPDIDVVQLDTTDPDSIQQAEKTISDKYEKLDILINNAGASFDKRQLPDSIKIESLSQDFELNYFGTVQVTQAFLPLLKKSSSAKIINISTKMRSFAESLNPNSSIYHGVGLGYQSSKAAVNMFIVQLAKQLRDEKTNITVNAVDPGKVATEFGGGTTEAAVKLGAQPVESGVARTIELATDPSNKDTATFSNTNGAVAW